MSSASGTRKLSTSDISDVRAHERERVWFREYVLELRLRRSVAMGAFISVSFESRETIRYQIQEMARVERLMTDVEIQTEIDTYNPQTSAGPVVRNDVQRGYL